MNGEEVTHKPAAVIYYKALVYTSDSTLADKLRLNRLLACFYSIAS